MFPQLSDDFFASVTDMDLPPDRSVSRVQKHPAANNGRMD